MKREKILPIILCGGSGTRLWPLSRESFPKQFIVLNENENKSLLQFTLERIKSLDYVEEPIIICNEDHRFIAAEQLREIGIKPKAILLEPVGRNTAPAITTSAIKATINGEDPILLVLSADHEIKDNISFLEAINVGFNYAKDNFLVTFGVLPSSPETRYGYIKAKKELNYNDHKGEQIDKFIEKPSKAIADKLILDKKYSWNSGIFMFKASTLLQEIDKYLPEMVLHCRESLETNAYDLDFQRLLRDPFEKCPNISIDHGLMEKTKNGLVIPLDAQWSDIGGWNAVWENGTKDNNGNSKLGKVLLNSSKNCYVRSEGRLLVGINLENLIIVETRDSVLISNKNDTEKVKEVVQKLKEDGFNEGKEHKKMNRPWGHYISIEEDSGWKIKKIAVTPGSSLSLQMHHHRSEHWIVVEGTAKVEIDSKEIILQKNQSTYIPLRSKHRLSNIGDKTLILIEVQSGDYLGEDDIIRFEDNYDRLN